MLNIQPNSKNRKMPWWQKEERNQSQPMVTSEDTGALGTGIFRLDTKAQSGESQSFYSPRHQQQAGNFEVISPFELFPTPSSHTCNNTKVLNLLISFGFKWTGDRIEYFRSYLDYSSTYQCSLFFSVFFLNFAIKYIFMF